MSQARIVLVLLALAAAAGTASAQPPALVATQQVEPGPYELTLSAKLGVLEAGEHRALAFEVAGRLAAHAAEGARVTAGDPVAELDQALERAELRQAELRLREARSERKRVRGLRQRDAASEKLLERASTDVEVRAAELDAAREHLGRRTLVAPFDGVVAETRLDPGEVATPGGVVVLFMELLTLRLEVGVPGYQVGQVEPGARVIVALPAFPGETFEGTVHRVAPAAAEGRHLFEVEIRVPNAQGRLRPGMSARADIVTGSLERAVSLPLEAAVSRNGGRVVYFAEDGRARAVAVDDATLDGTRLVLAPPPAQRELVVRGQHDLRDGAALRVDNTVLEGARQDGSRGPTVVPVAGREAAGP